MDFKMRLKIVTIVSMLMLNWICASANTIFIAMDQTQSNHLKAYGIAYWIIEQGVEVDWLLNYKGGSFMVDYFQKLKMNSLSEGSVIRSFLKGSKTELLMKLPIPRPIQIL